MKFNLTITDMSDEEFNRVVKQLNMPLEGDIVIKPHTTEEIVAPTAPVELPADTVDKDGLKWDGRIHSSNHQMTAKGVWQRRRGVSDEEFNAVRNELLGLAPTNEPVATQAPVISPDMAAINHTLYSTPEELAKVPPYTPTPAPVVAPAPLAQPQAPVAPVAPEPTPTPVSTDIMFQTMFKKLQTGLGNNTLKGNDIKNLLDSTNAQFGLQCQNLTQFKDNVSAIQYIINELTVRGL